MPGSVEELDGVPGMEPVMAFVADLAAAFEVAGYRLYLVGGVVRDLLAGLFTDADDLDLTTDAEPIAIRRLVGPRASALWTQGERFGTIGATIGGRQVEITTHRAEVYDETTRQPTVAFGQSIDEDLSRRDFTINAMAVRAPAGVLLDPYGGRDDLEQRRLRTPLAPDVSFNDDPLRMLRAARFLPRFDLAPDPALVEAATAMADRLTIVSVERVHDELERLLALTEPGRGLSFLAATGLLAKVISGLDGEPGAAAVAIASRPGSALARRAGLLWPLGLDGASTALRALRYSTADRRQTAALLAAAAAIVDEDSVSQMRIRTVVDRIGTEAMVDLEALCRAVGEERSVPFFDSYRALASTEDLTDLDAALTGSEIIEHLGIEPGPDVGAAIDHLRQHRLIQGPATPGEARAVLDRWWADRADGG